MSSAQLDILPPDEASSQMEAATPFALKEQVAERLAAHRARRHMPGSAPTPITPAAPAKSRSSRIAAAVAERYAHSQSYRAFLAEEAERAIRQAEAAAEIAALNARAVAEAQNQLLFELDQLTAEAPAPSPVLVPAPIPTPETAPGASALPITEVPTQTSSPVFTIRLYEDAAHPIVSEPFAIAHPLHKPALQLDEAEDLALDEEIAFRQSPVFEPATPPIDIPANLIEFPRQLVAPRKARPRLAEGPLREEAVHTSDPAQLRIFEVEPTQISTAPAVESAAPEWSSIMLSALPAAAPVETPEAPFNPVLPLMTAPLRLRLMATIVDICIVTAGLLAFVSAFALTAGKLLERFPSTTTNHMPPQLAAITALAVFAFLYLLCQTLFFTFSEATPGMRFARIGLCTFSDENPTRAAIRRRLFACLLSACPLGLGFLWAFLDDDRLGWHDRISRMYQRSY